MTDRTSPVSGVAERYASALFDLSREGDGIQAVEADLSTPSAAPRRSADLRRLVESPVFSAEDQERAVAAIAARAELGTLVAQFPPAPGPQPAAFRAVGDHPVVPRHGGARARRGDRRGDVGTSARRRPDIESLKAVLRDRLGKDVTIETRVNPALLGGLVVKVGSRMIDTSLRTKLMTVKTHLKEVG